MKRIFFSAIYSAVLALGACASAPSYAPASSASASGYTDNRIEDDRFRVTYRGAPKMGPSAVQDYALMRAAQLTLEHGGDWFEVVRSDTQADSKTRYSTDTDFGPDFAVQQSCGLLGCTSRAVPVGMRSQHDEIETRTVFEHSMEIRIGEGAKATNPDAYDASETYGALKARLT